MGGSTNRVPTLYVVNNIIGTRGQSTNIYTFFAR